MLVVSGGITAIALRRAEPAPGTGAPVRSALPKGPGRASTLALTWSA